ncbi:MAG: flagellar type III secretion system pore protein FliP [Planctomycetales bacterium]|nr:flagellar type III secretion system pore protein FliP [Planctomycetales bacterium]
MASPPEALRSLKLFIGFAVFLCANSVVAIAQVPTQSSGTFGVKSGLSNQTAPTDSLFEQVTNSLDQQMQKAGDQAQESFFMGGPEKWTSREGLSSSLQIILLLTVLSLAPAVLLMTTCYVRIIVVLGLLRQALGTGQLPPSQVITSIALFMTLFIMSPIWNQVYDQAIKPYTAPDSTMSMQEAWEAGVNPIRTFMSLQISFANNDDDVMLFYAFYQPGSTPPAGFEDVPLRVLLPAFMLSELKTAFLMGFQIFLPFLLIDLVVAAVTISMGMMMLPPAMISLPFKLLLFVLVDGWRLVIGMLLESFGTLA